MSLAVSPSEIDFSSSPQQIQGVTSILRDKYFDSELLARQVQKLNSLRAISYSIFQDMRKCSGLQFHLHVQFIHFNVPVFFVYLALQSYIFDIMKNAFMQYIVNCNIVSMVFNSRFRELSHNPKPLDRDFLYNSSCSSTL